MSPQEITQHERNLHIGEALKKFRAESGLSQADLARKLGITQVHVSRIERGQGGLSDHLVSKLFKIIKEPLAKLYDFRVDVLNDEKWRFCSFRYPEQYCGDRVYINVKFSADRTTVLHADAAGSDITASEDADKLRLIYEATLSALGQDLIFPETIYQRINKTFKQTREMWRGEPSAFLITANKANQRIDFVNGGMPHPLVFTAKDGEVRRPLQDRFPPIGNFSGKLGVYSSTLKMQEQDTVMFCSDGFVEAFNNYSSLPLETVFGSLSKAQRGDPEGIGRKILRLLRESIKTQASRGRHIVSDNFSN